MAEQAAVQAMHGTGNLVVVVGPSAAGKDTLLRGAAAGLASNPWIMFARREITRPRDIRREDSIEVGAAEFAKRLASGGYALAWPAHDCHYGIPASIDDELARGVTVIANVSRGVLDEARRKYGTVTVISVTVEPDILKHRLRTRGDASEAEIRERLARAAAYVVQGDDVIELPNNGPPEIAVDKLIAILSKFGESAFGQRREMRG
jgi:ribose 1,5-bisphosphokinase